MCNCGERLGMTFFTRICMYLLCNLLIKIIVYRPYRLIVMRHSSMQLAITAVTGSYWWRTPRVAKPTTTAIKAKS